MQKVRSARRSVLFVFTEIPEVATIRSSKLGRPNTMHPKSNRFSIRLDDNTLERLDFYCLDAKVKRAEAIRRGIALLLENQPK